MIAIDQLFSDQIFSICDLISFIISNQHSSFMKTFLVALILGLIQQNSVILTLDLQIFTDFQSRQVSVSWNVNDFDWFNVDHFFSQTILLSQWGLLSQIRNGHPIIGGITWNASNNTSTLVHANCHHWECIDFLSDCQWSSQRETHHIRTFKFANNLNFLIFSCQILIGHISC